MRRDSIRPQWDRYSVYHKSYHLKENFCVVILKDANYRHVLGLQLYLSSGPLFCVVVMSLSHSTLCIYYVKCGVCVWGPLSKTTLFEECPEWHIIKHDFHISNVSSLHYVANKLLPTV